MRDCEASSAWWYLRRGAVTGLCALLLWPSVVRAGQSSAAQAQLSSPAFDAELIAALRKNGVRVESGRVTAWFSPDSVPREEMADLVRRLGKGVDALETFLRAPRPWQDSRRHRVEYFFKDGPFFVPHATVDEQVLIPVSRLRDGQAPILHETTHALLTLPQGRRPLAWLTEGVAAYVAKRVSAETGIHEGDRFELGDIHELDAKCAAGLSSEQGPRILPFIGAPGNLSALYAMEPAVVVRQVFYGCAAAFTKYLVDRMGIEAVVDVLPERDPHKRLEEITGSKMAVLRSAWIAAIGGKL